MKRSQLIHMTFDIVLSDHTIVAEDTEMVA